MMPSRVRSVLNRMTEMFIVTMWLVSMAWLVARDAVPRWFAEAPPQVASRAWLADQGTEFQYAIYDHNGLRKPCPGQEA